MIVREMLFRGSYSLLLVLYSTAVINLNCLLGFFFNSCFLEITLAMAIRQA